MIRVITWNLNSIRARIENLTKFILEYNPTVLLLQEIKCLEHQFPFEQFESLGYNIVVNLQKMYNGVAIMSKGIIEDVNCEIHSDSLEARYIECISTINNECIRFISVYVPHGTDFDSPMFQKKLLFLEHFYNKLKNLLLNKEKLIIGGDFNIAPGPNDLSCNYNKSKEFVCYSLQERNYFRKIINLGLVDVSRLYLGDDTTLISWWDYRTKGFIRNSGMRLDHILSSPNVIDSLLESNIHKDIRGWIKPSDHVPVSITLDL